jgi:hypothetical protein
MIRQSWQLAMIVPILAVGITPCTVYGDEPPVTAKDLSEFCQSKDVAVHNACKSFILGVFQTLSIEGGVQGKRVCIPDNLSSPAMEFAIRDAMARDLEFYPADKNMPAISSVSAVIAKTFACSSPK